MAAPVLERITPSGMHISWAEGSAGDIKHRQRTVAPFYPPLRDGAEAGSRLVALARRTEMSRIPCPQVPPLGITLFNLFGLPLFLMVAFRPDALPRFIMRIYDAIFLNSRAAQHATGVLCVIIHIVEGVYSCVLMAKVTSWRTLGHPRALFWTVQTTIIGYPSLSLLINRLKTINRPAHRKSS